MGVPLLDLKAQYATIKKDVLAAIDDVMESQYFILGPRVQELEDAISSYSACKHAVGVSSGTDALLISLMTEGIGAGDEVITTPYSFFATAGCVSRTGAKPVFVDIDPVSLNIDPSKIEACISEKTKAILPVEVFGNPAGLDSVCEIARKHNLPVIEDSCEALGSALKGKKAGTFGTMSVFGFYPNKQITTGEGGMILTDDDNLAEQCVSLRNQGRGKDAGWLAHERLGYNYRLSDINCALGIVQLSRIDEIKAKRRQVAEWYREMLADEDRLIIPAEPEQCDMSWFVFVVRLAEGFTMEQRDRILRQMQSQNIQVSNYFAPVHLMPFIAEKFGHKPGDFPIAESASARAIALPFHNHLTKDQIAIVCTTLKQLLAG